MGFELKCVKHNHLNNQDDLMIFHLFQEHQVNIPFKNWKSLFTRFSIGDSLSDDYRCRLCGFEFMLESQAKEHFKSHGLRMSKK